MKEIPRKYQCEYCKKVSESQDEIRACEYDHEEKHKAEVQRKEDYEKSLNGVKSAYENYLEVKKAHFAKFKQNELEEVFDISDFAEIINSLF